MRKSRASKVIAGFVGFATAVTMSFGTASAATTEELTAQIASLLATITSLQSQLSTMQGGSSTVTTGSVSHTFAKNLKMGMTSPDVMALQKVLNANSATQVAMTGAGSPGMESSYFGAKTKAAVIKFQELHKAEILTPVGLTHGTGLVGASTRALLNTVSVGTGTGTGVTTYPDGCTSATGFSSTTGANCATGTVVVGNNGPVSVVLSSDTPVSGTIVVGQATADLAHFTFTGSGTVNSIMLKRSGISDQNTLSDVYLYDGNTRLTDGYSFNNNGDITISNLGLVVNGMKVISVKADVSSSAVSGQTIAIWLTSFTAGVTATTVSLGGNMMSVASGSTLATASFGANTVSPGCTTTCPTVNAGVASYTFWSAPLQINTRTVSLKNIAFRMIGSAPADALSSIKLFVDGIDTGKVATVGMIQGANYATFDFTGAPMNLNTGSHTLDVRATIEKGSNRTVQFSLQQVADLMILDPQVGVNIAVGGTIPNSAGTITINTGSITANIDTTFQAMTNITGGASNVPIAKFKLHAYGEDVKVSSLVITPVLTGATPGNTGLDDVTLYFNGSQIGTSQDWPATLGNLTYQLGSQLIAPVGVDSVLEVRANIRTSTSTNYTAGSLSANLVLGVTNAQGQSSLATLNTPAVTGNILTVQTGLLQVAKNSGYLSQNQNPNTAGVKIGSFVLQNQSSSESVRITSLLVALGVGSATSLANFSALKTSETSGSGSTPVQPQASNTFSVDLTLAPGATKTLDIFADSGSDFGANASITPTLTVTSIGVTSNVSAVSSAIPGQNILMSAGTVGVPSFVASSATVAQLIAAANGGSADGSKAVFNFTSTGAASTISELKFAVTGDNTVTSVKVGSVSAPVVAGVAYLTGLNLAVPFGGSGLNVEALVSYSEVGISGISSNTNSSIALSYFKYTSGGSSTASTTSITAPTMVVVGSKPSFAVTDVSTLLTNGLVRVADITITADAKGDIKLGQLPISITSTGVASTSASVIVVKDSTDASITTTNATISVPAGGTATANVIFGASLSLANAYLIPAGTSKTFRIYVTASGVAGAVNTTSFSTKLGVNTSVQWYDVAGNGSSALDAASVFNYPTDTSVISN